MALTVAVETMDVPLPPPSDPNYLRLLSIRKDAAVSIIGAGLKADENRFRHRQNDVLATLFDRVLPEAPALAGPVIDAA